MEIRRAKPEDAESVKKIHIAAYQTSYRGYLPDNELDSMVADKERIQRTAAYIQTVECHVVQDDNNKIVGFAYVIYPAADIFEIQALYIHPHYQRKGFGSALVSKLCAEKKAQGYNKFIVWTLKEGPSIGFYKKMGLRQVFGQEKSWKYNLRLIQFEKEL